MLEPIGTDGKRPSGDSDQPDLLQPPPAWPDSPLSSGGAPPKPSTLNSQPSTLNPQPSTLNPQPSTLSPQPGTL